MQKTTDVVKEGDKVKVKLLGFDERGKVRLSMKVVDQETGEDLEAKQKSERSDRREAAGAAIIPHGHSPATNHQGRLRAPLFCLNTQLNQLVNEMRTFCDGEHIANSGPPLLSNHQERNAPVTNGGRR